MAAKYCPLTAVKKLTLDHAIQTIHIAANSDATLEPVSQLLIAREVAIVKKRAEEASRDDYIGPYPKTHVRTRNEDYD